MANILVYSENIIEQGKDLTVWTACLISKHVIATATTPEAAVSNLSEWLETAVEGAKRGQIEPLAEHQDTPAEFVSRFNAGRPWTGPAPDGLTVRVD